MRRLKWLTGSYAWLLFGTFLVALTAGWTPLATQIDNNAYDLIFRTYRPPVWEPESAVLAIDEETLQAMQGQFGLRKTLAEALERLNAAAPKAVVVDVVLADAGNPADDDRLEKIFQRLPNLVLSTDLLPEGKGWEDPLPRFRRWAAAVGHVHAEQEQRVCRDIPLEKATERERRWALALEAFRTSRQATILESPRDLQVGEVTIPAAREDGRRLRIRYRPPDSPVPRISVKQLQSDPGLAERFTRKVVFVGVTAQTLVRDRLATPYSAGDMTPGVEIHANAFETLSQRLFLTTVSNTSVVLYCLAIVVLSGVTFAFLSGWWAYLAAGGILLLAHALPYLLFTSRAVLPYSPVVSSAWLSVVAAAAYQHFVVRRRLHKTEAERTRYQQAMHFVTHEMRTPLTAIQGSSELMSRYQLTEEKRKQIAQMIHSESKRLGGMIEIFLSVERLTAGQIELKKEVFKGSEVISKCVERTCALAERKQIRISLDTLPEDSLTGDRELMEYAFYNLLTNAVKYSPPRTEVTVFGSRRDGRVCFSVRDQGIGMDQKDVRKVFQRFYRTKQAEQSGEAGTGIGLSIVEQIVEQHGGSIEVASALGKGSCFTVVLPAATSTTLE